MKNCSEKPIEEIRPELIRDDVYINNRSHVLRIRAINQIRVKPRCHYPVSIMNFINIINKR